MDSEKPDRQAEENRLAKHPQDGLLPVTLFCSLLGMLLGPLPAVFCTLALKTVFYPMFAVGPLIICFLTLLLKGSRDRRGFIIIAVFSLMGAYLTVLACQAALYVLSYSSMSAAGIPLITVLSIGKRGVLPASASSYIYPLLFTALGVAAARDILYHKDRLQR